MSFTLDRRALGRTGLAVSPLGFGGGPVGYLDIAQERVTKLLNTLLDAGVNVIDTAARYKGSEEVIGNAVAHRRDEYVLVSKCGRSADREEGVDWSPELIMREVDRSLQRLRTDHLDVMLLHSCGEEVLERGEALGTLLRARDAGKVRHVGFSGDNETAVYAAGLADVSVIEMSINICDQANISTALPAARENNVGVIAKRPLANSVWKGTSRLPGIYAAYSQAYADRLSRMKLDLPALGFPGSPTAAWGELALRFTMSQPGVGTAIAGTTDPTHAEANLAAAGHGPLSEEVISAVREAFRQAEAESGEEWKGRM